MMQRKRCAIFGMWADFNYIHLFGYYNKNIWWMHFNSCGLYFIATVHGKTIVQIFEHQDELTLFILQSLKYHLNLEIWQRNKRLQHVKEKEEVGATGEVHNDFLN